MKNAVITLNATLATGHVVPIKVMKGTGSFRQAAWKVVAGLMAKGVPIDCVYNEKTGVMTFTYAELMSLRKAD